MLLSPPSFAIKGLPNTWINLWCINKKLNDEKEVLLTF
jgi:hypothetical protein